MKKQGDDPKKQQQQKNVRLAYLTRYRASKEEFTPKNKTKKKKKNTIKNENYFPLKKTMDLATLGRYIMM